MTNADREEFRQIFVGLAGEWGGKVDSPTLLLKFNALVEYSIEQIRGAAGWLIINRRPDKNGNFWPACPTAGEIVSAIEAINGVASIATRAVIQADIVLNAIVCKGHWWNAKFDDPVTNHLTKSRWVSVRKSLSKALPCYHYSNHNHQRCLEIFSTIFVATNI